MVKLLVLALLPLLAVADVFLHNPRGSNNRGCERNENRRNANRLFDSENNARGGYACPWAWPFPCYIHITEAERDECNSIYAQEDHDNVTGLMDNGGVIHEKATRTPRLYFYEGSQLQIEWTNQHGCGENPRTHCDVILQYACEDTLADEFGQPRDGTPLNNHENNNRGNVNYESYMGLGSSNVNRRDRDQENIATIPTSIEYGAQSDPRFGRHESLTYYLKCRSRTRNRGLWAADVGMRSDATGTRQNPGGNRHGLECPEERDYYPYWAPSPWRDIAILTDRVEDCGWMQANSQNVASVGECICPSCDERIPIDADSCTAFGGEWVMVPPKGGGAPFCGAAPTTRENHLGNPIGGGKSSSAYNWTIPAGSRAETCFIRVRYNISTADRDPTTGVELTVDGTWLDNEPNNVLHDRQRSEEKTYVRVIEYANDTHPGAQLGLATNMDQFGRTFEDRSYSFEIKPAPSGGECKGKSIYNLNVRGKRGNIVQTFPAVEYDFVPSEMYVSDLDCVHVQWTGSDYNPNRNANNAYGGPGDPTNLNRGRTDRNNLVQIPRPNYYHFVQSLDYNWNMFWTTRQRKIHLAWIGQPIEDTHECLPIETILSLSAQADADDDLPASERNPFFRDNGQNWLDDNNDRDRYYKNCGKLSGARTPYFDGGLFAAGVPGTYYYMCTRQNSFSNRNQQGILHVVSFLTVGANGFLMVGGLSALAALGLAGGVFFSRRNQKNIIEGEVNANGVIMPRRNSPGQAPKSAKPGMSGVVGGKVGGADSATTVTAIYNHQASEAGELEFRKGDVITVLRKDESGWWEGRTPDGKKGIFPSNYVQG